MCVSAVFSLPGNAGAAPPANGNIAAELTGLPAEIAGSRPSFSYTAPTGRSDDLHVRLVGGGETRALLVEARGVNAAPGCDAPGRPGLLRCPVPGGGRILLDIDLRDGSDKADIRVRKGAVDLDLGGGSDSAYVRVPRGAAWVHGGDGNDRLAGVSTGSAPPDYYPGHPMEVLGPYVSPWNTESDTLVRLSGGAGADQLRGGRSADGLEGGPGADTVGAGPGHDAIFGGPGPDDIDAGTGRDMAAGGAGNDRISAADDVLDIIRCQAGRDHAGLDGLDVSRRCERRTVAGAARAVALWAMLTEYGENLDVLISCPVDAKEACATDITIRVRRGRAITRSLEVASGESRILGVWKLSNRDKDWIARGGVRVTVRTHQGGKPALLYTRRLRVVDNRPGAPE